MPDYILGGLDFLWPPLNIISALDHYVQPPPPPPPRIKGSLEYNQSARNNWPPEIFYTSKLYSVLPTLQEKRGGTHTAADI